MTLETLEETLRKADARAKGRAVAVKPGDERKLTGPEVQRREALRRADEQFADLQAGTLKRRDAFGVTAQEATGKRFGCMIELLKYLGTESGFSPDQAHVATIWREVTDQNSRRLGVGRIKSGSDLDSTYGYDSAEESDAEISMNAAIKARYTELSHAGFDTGGQSGMAALCAIMHMDPMSRVSPRMIADARSALNGMVAVNNRGRGLAK
jgi:hypothetical protein